MATAMSDLTRLELKINMLEKEFRATSKLDTLMRAMIEMELEMVYKQYMDLNTNTHRYKKPLTPQ
jgi:hypothetical protein